MSCKIGKISTRRRKVHHERLVIGALDTFDIGSSTRNECRVARDLLKKKTCAGGAVSIMRRTRGRGDTFPCPFKGRRGNRLAIMERRLAQLEGELCRVVVHGKTRSAQRNDALILQIEACERLEELTGHLHAGSVIGTIGIDAFRGGQKRLEHDIRRRFRIGSDSTGPATIRARRKKRKRGCREQALQDISTVEQFVLKLGCAHETTTFHT